MTYLDSLKESKRIREKLEEDTFKLKTIVMDIHKLHSEYNGEFLEKLEEFLNSYK